MNSFTIKSDKLNAVRLKGHTHLKQPSQIIEKIFLIHLFAANTHSFVIIMVILLRVSRANQSSKKWSQANN